MNGEKVHGGVPPTTPARLRTALAEHERWLVSSGARGRRLVRVDADLRGVDLAGCRLDHAVLSGADLRDADLRGASLVGALLDSAVLSGADLRYGHLVDAEVDGVLARRIRLDRADLTRSSLIHADLTGSRFDGAALAGTLLIEADLRACGFAGARFERASCYGARFSGAEAPELATGAGGRVIASFSRLDIDGRWVWAGRTELQAWWTAAGADVAVV